MVTGETAESQKGSPMEACTSQRMGSHTTVPSTLNQHMYNGHPFGLECSLPMRR